MEAQMIDTEDIVHYGDAMETERDDDGNFDIDLIGNSEQHHFEMTEDIEIIDYEEDNIRYETDEAMIVDMRTPQPGDIDIPIDDRDHYSNSNQMEIHQVSSEAMMGSPTEHPVSQPLREQPSTSQEEQLPSQDEPSLPQQTEHEQNSPAPTNPLEGQQETTEEPVQEEVEAKKGEHDDATNQTQDPDQRSRSSSATVGNESATNIGSEFVPEVTATEADTEGSDSKSGANLKSATATDPSVGLQPITEDSVESAASLNKIQPVMVWWEQRELCLYNKEYYLSPQEVDPTLSPEELEYPVEFLFPDISLHDKSLDQLFGELRRLFDTDEDDELTLFVEDLGLTFHEDNTLTQHFNLADIQRLFERFEKSQPRFLTLYLQTEPRITKLFSELLTAAAENRRLEDVQISHDVSEEPEVLEDVQEGHDVSEEPEELEDGEDVSGEPEELETAEAITTQENVHKEVEEVTTVTTHTILADAIHRGEINQGAEDSYQEDYYEEQQELQTDQADTQIQGATGTEGITNFENQGPQEQQPDQPEQNDDAEGTLNAGNGKIIEQAESEPKETYAASDAGEGTGDADDQGEISELDDHDIVDLAELNEYEQDTYNESDREDDTADATADHTANQSPDTEEGFDEHGEDYERHQEEVEEPAEGYDDEYAENYDEEYPEEYSEEHGDEYKDENDEETAELIDREQPNPHNEEFQDPSAENNLEIPSPRPSRTPQEQEAANQPQTAESNGIGYEINQVDEEIYEFEDQGDASLEYPEAEVAGAIVDLNGNEFTGSDGNEEQAGDATIDGAEQLDPIEAKAEQSPVDDASPVAVQTEEDIVYEDFEYGDQADVEEGEDIYYGEDDEESHDVTRQEEESPEQGPVVSEPSFPAVADDFQEAEKSVKIGGHDEVTEEHAPDVLAERAMEEFSTEVTEEDFELLYADQSETIANGLEAVQDQTRHVDVKRMREDDGVDGENSQPKGSKRTRAE